MWQIARKLSLGFSLIVAASAILLLSDPPRRVPTTNEEVSGTVAVRATCRVVLLQMASQLIMEEGAAGVIDALRELGYDVDRNLTLKRLNAEGDTATVNAMAQEATGGAYDLIVTLSTPCLQAVANANKQRRVPHVFGLVTDPRQSGVGVGADPLEHPAHLVGVGTMQPVAESFRIAKQCNPKLMKLGVVWNPAEINSEINTRLARDACRELQIELLEANAENTLAVKQAAASLIARDVDAFWIGGDVTVLAAIDVMIRAAKQAGVPVFTCIPGNAAKGTLFDVGANYYEVGRTVGNMSARVLNGTSIAKIPVESVVPPKLVLNQTALLGLRGTWSFPTDLVDKADTVIDDRGTHERQTVAMASAPTRTWQLEILGYVNTLDVEDSQRGLLEGLKQAGLLEGKDFTIRTANAQGDMAALSTMVDSARARRADLLLTVSTQALQAAKRGSGDLPVVFTMVANPFLAGVAKSDEQHLPRFTGSYGANDVEAMMPLIRQLLPNAKRLGALYAPAETNAAYSHELLVKAAAAAGYELISLPINSPTDVPDAAYSLCSRGIDAICLPNSNLAGASFSSIAKAAQRAKLPVFAFLAALAPQGASVVISRDFYDMAVDAGRLAARIIRGEDPAKIPLHPTRKSKLIINPTAAAATGLKLPDDLLKKADDIVR
jgi:ABC-type uncharacterized transport system substrate-binding protein